MAAQTVMKEPGQYTISEGKKKKKKKIKKVGVTSKHLFVTEGLFDVAHDGENFHGE